jgi:septal ring factor EnvC (AmiA/AmiB activator)
MNTTPTGSNDVRSAALIRQPMAAVAVLLLVMIVQPAAAQDIRGLEVCTAEKQMERRTGCLQANAEFLQQELARLKRDSGNKLAAFDRELAAAKTEIATLKATLTKIEAELAQIKSKAEPGTKKP